MSITSGGNPSIVVISTVITDINAVIDNGGYVSRLNATGTYLSLHGTTVTVHVGGTYEFKQCDASTGYTTLVTSQVHYNQNDTFTVPDRNIMYVYTYLG